MDPPGKSDRKSDPSVDTAYRAWQQCLYQSSFIWFAPHVPPLSECRKEYQTYLRAARHVKSL